MLTKKQSDALIRKIESARREGEDFLRGTEWSKKDQRIMAKRQRSLCLNRLPKFKVKGLTGIGVKRA